MITVTRNEREYKLYFLHHMLHHSNLENVLTNGLLSHSAAHTRGLVLQDISMSEVQNRRSARRIDINGTIYQIHDFVPLYFNSRNPMLYKRRNIQDELVILFIDPEVINRELTVFTDGNAANNGTKFYMGQNNLINIPFELILGDSWNHENPIIKRENVRKMCAEVLVYPSVEIAAINGILCPNQMMKQYTNNILKRIGDSVSHIHVEAEGAFFFF